MASEPSGKLYLGLHAEEIGRELVGLFQYYHVRLCPVRIYESGHIRGISWGSFTTGAAEQHAEMLAGLQVNCQGSADHASRHNGVYGWDTEYRDVHAIDSRRAKAMAKTLDHVDRALHRLRGEWGEPATYGQYCLRVARALGAVELVFTSRNDRFRGYDDTDMQRRTLAEGAETIDCWIRFWQQEAAAQTVPC